jgi:membrane protease subunit HflC
MKFKTLIIPAIIVIIAVFSAAYVVDETEQVVITQFGEAIGDPKTEPGLYFKIPVVQRATYFPKNLLEWDGDPGQVPTLDKTFIYVDTFARWKVVDTLKFFQTVNNVTSAMARLDDIIDAAVRNFITSHHLIETVRNSNRELDTFEIGLGLEREKEQEPRKALKIKKGRQSITKGILEQAQPKVQEFGIQLVDVKIKRLNYVEEVRRSVYDRMIAERKQIAEKFRSEGQGEARKIEGKQERDLKRITSEAYREAQQIKGKADAEATRVYASALNQDPEFYSFLRTLEIYKETMDEKSSLILSTDSDFLRFFKGYKSEESMTGE